MLRWRVSFSCSREFGATSIRSSWCDFPRGRHRRHCRAIAAREQSRLAVPSYATPPALSLPLFAVLGILAGALGVAFNRGVLGLLGLFERIGYRWALPVGVAVGAGVGLVGRFSPVLVGGGHSLADSPWRGM